MYKFNENGRELSLSYNGKTVFVHSENSPFVVLSNDEVSFSSSHGAFSYKLKRGKGQYPLCKAEVKGDTVTFSAGDALVSVTVTEEDGCLRLSPKAKGAFNSVRFNFAAQKGEHIFGGGEQYRQLNLKGEKVINMVSEHIVVAPIAEKVLFGKIKPYRPRPHNKIHTYSPMSVFVSDQRYAISADVDQFGVQDFTQAEVSSFTYFGMPRAFRYYAADSFMQLSRDLNKSYELPYSEFLPDWAYNGMILGVQGGIERVTEKAESMLRKGAKICGVWCQDWSGKNVTAAGSQVYWNWEVDNATYPELKQRIAALKEKGVHFLAYINPYLIKDGTLYNECKNKGYLITRKDGSIYHIKSTTFDAGMFDLTNPDTVTFLKDTIINRNMLQLGIDGYMADFGEYLPVDCVLRSGESALALHNLWPTIWARINREAVEESGRANEIFFFTRSGYNKVQGYTTMMWTGDQHTDFSVDYGMPCVLPASLNLGFSGLPAVHSDVGGFISFASLKRDKELYIRWLELTAFSPLMRGHETIRPDKNTQYDSPGVTEYTVLFSNVHSLIKPYLLALMEEAKQGIPVMRTAFYQYNDMAQYHTDYQYMLGDELYVAPVLSRDCAEITAFLPQGNWRHLFTEKEYSAGAHVVPCPMGTPAVFYKTDGTYASIFQKVAAFVKK